MRTLAALAIGLFACRATDRIIEPPPAAAARPAELDLVPRSHAIPPGHLADVRKLFEAHLVSMPISVVSSAGTNTQFVNPQPTFIGDHFVVAATPEIHAELDTLLAALAKQPPTPPPSTYAITYWAIEAAPSATTDIAPELAELEPVLKSLGPLGPRRFRTLDRVSTRSIDGAQAKIESRRLDVDQTLSTDNAGLQLSLVLRLHSKVPPEMTPHTDQIEAKFPLAPDKPVVLGQTGDSAGSNAADLVLYVVRAQRAE
jgi:hypothetical protein